MPDHPRYNEKVKRRARRKALSRAVKLVTRHRDRAAVVPQDYVRRVRKAKRRSDNAYDHDAVGVLAKSDIREWERWRDESIGRRKASEITVAYLAGAHPTNDLTELIRLGVRPENIWAFENTAELASAGVEDLQDLAARGVKFFNVGIEAFLATTDRRFDIIYLDACASFVDGCRMVATVFRNASLASLGVLVTNFSKPDETNEAVVARYSRLMASYLFFKRFWTRPNGDITESPQAYGYGLTADDPYLEDQDEAEQPKIFVDAVRRRFGHYYGQFVTQSIMDLGTIVAPMSRLATSPLWRQFARVKIEEVADRGKSMLAFGADDEQLHGEAIGAADTTSLLWAFAACGSYGSLSETTAPPAEDRKFISDWMRKLGGMPETKYNAAMLTAAYHGLRIDRSLQSEALAAVTNYSYSDMAFLCDVPNAELGFYAAIAQIAHPMHCNVRQARRYRYVARTNEMYLDVLTFDECRYVYDWLASPALMTDDWSDESRQLVFRFALDAIAKSAHLYQGDVLYGCNAIGIDRDFPELELRRRTQLK